jgi:hypothetical protein
MTHRKRVAMVALAVGLSAAGASPVFAGPPEPGKGGCNSGNGNGQETTVENDCDPGNSGGHNNGGG